MKHTRQVGISIVLGNLLVMSIAAPAAAEYDGVVARYTTGGALDTTFNGTGKAISTTTGDDAVYDVKRDASGRYVACGYFTNASAEPQLIVGRYNSNGTVDTTFGWLGVTTASWPDPTVSPSCVIDASGRIVVAPIDYTGGDTSPPNAFLLIRFLSTGALDTTFGIGGYSSAAISGTTLVEHIDVKIASDGKIVTAGVVEWPSGDQDFVVMRYSSNGVLDSTFSGDGVITTNIGLVDGGGALALDSSNRPVVVGVSGPTAPSETMTVLRYTTSGILDTTFDSDGKQTVAFSSFTGSQASGVGIDSSSRIVTAGAAFTSTSNVMAIARLNGNVPFAVDVT